MQYKCYESLSIFYTDVSQDSLIYHKFSGLQGLTFYLIPNDNLQTAFALPNYQEV